MTRPLPWLALALVAAAGCARRDAAASRGETTGAPAGLAGLIAGDEIGWDVRARIVDAPDGATLIVTIRTGPGAPVAGARVEAGPPDPASGAAVVLAETAPGRYERPIPRDGDAPRSVTVRAFHEVDHYLGSSVVTPEAAR